MTNPPLPPVAPQPIQVGDVSIDTPVVLAPMTGVTDLPFRKLVRRYGSGLNVTEMIASEAAIRETRQSVQKAAWDAIEEPVSMQLVGCDPQSMADAAKLQQDNGAAIIDINFGCPVRKVVGQLAGSALMREVPLATKLMEATVKAVDVPVTVKMRMGWDHADLNAPELARIAEDLGFETGMFAGSVASLTVLGAPDHIVITMTEFAEQCRRICRAGVLPLMVDADHCYGNPLNVYRTVKELISAGAAGCFLEDQQWPKKCGHMAGKRVIDREEYVQKIRAADEADLMLIAPATANTLAKLAHGLADDALGCVALALRPEAKVLVAPAMNGSMWRHPATVANVATLTARGAEFVGPDDGLLSCGYEGIGRLWPVDGIANRALELLGLEQAND